MTLPTLVLIVAMGMIGLAMLLTPGKEKQAIGLFLRPLPVRIFGAALIALAIWMYIAARPGPVFAETLYRTAAVLVLLWGGVAVVLPETIIVATENWSARSHRAHRIAGIVFLILAAFLRWAANP